MAYRNSEGYSDPTAGKAIENASRNPGNSARAPVEKVIDDVYRLRWNKGSVRDCKDRAVIAKYGRGGKCIVPVYLCRKCRNEIRYSGQAGTSCRLEQEGSKNG